MSNSQKQDSNGAKVSNKQTHTKTDEQNHKASSHKDLSTKSAPDNSGKTGSHKSKSS